jgi:hypothetical protein
VTAGRPKVSIVGWEEFLALSWPRTTRTKGYVPKLYLGPNSLFHYAAKSLIYLASRGGFEPAINRSTAVGGHPGVNSGVKT